MALYWRASNAGVSQRLEMDSIIELIIGFRRWTCRLLLAYFCALGGSILAPVSNGGGAEASVRWALVEN